ncbi:hypothetical protein DBR32_08110 [Taibaiella sp. KBW10]|uniref:sensor histidine kinase n=1 Tax=Taibaiella sp. KBW10 TaxID=2153357 RepID=UPI000F59E72B|nr:histidine kinase [Taibaiella sp. KBW10]RQO30686.1 hypothetical protein DBR32_08110 [Taibaiella sp. KBW10]
MDSYIYIIIGMSASFLLSISLLLFYLKYRKNIIQQQYQMKEAEVQHQKDLLYTVINSQEQERKRIGMDLHDEVGSVLSSLRLMIEDFADKNQQEQSKQFNTQSKKTIDNIIGSVRSISHNLSPMFKGSYGFSDALYNFTDGINASGRIRINLSFEDNSLEVPLSQTEALTFYRVLIEMINNTIKHAEADHINIGFSLKENIFHIDYADDGKGLDKELGSKKRGMGLRNIESRLSMVAATYTIDYNAEKGYHAVITFSTKAQ